MANLGGVDVLHRVTPSSAIPVTLPGVTSGGTEAFLSPNRALVDRELPAGGQGIFAIDLGTGAVALLATEADPVLFF